MPMFKKAQSQSAAGPSDDEIREYKLERVKGLAERFTYDLGLLIAGHDVNFEEYLDPAAAQRLRESIEPFLASGDAMRPNFGDYGELRIEGYLLSNLHDIHAYVEFDDQSVRETMSGELIPTPRKRMLLSLVIDPTASAIRDYKLQPAGS